MTPPPAGWHVRKGGLTRQESPGEASQGQLLLEGEGPCRQCCKAKNIYPKTPETFLREEGNGPIPNDASSGHSGLAYTPDDN